MCEVCSGIFEGDGKLEQLRPHHQNESAVHAASAQGCYICRTISLDITLGKERLGVQSLEWCLSSTPKMPEGWLQVAIRTTEPGDTVCISSDEGSVDTEASSSSGSSQSLVGASWGWWLQPEKGKCSHVPT